MSVKILNDRGPIGAVYSGRHGCACGCRGNHSSNPKTIKQIVRKIEKAASEGFEVVIWPGCYIAVETETRSYIAYTDGRTS